METKEKLSKLQPDLASPRKTVENGERAARIQYLKDLFRLSFRTHTAYEECLRETMDEVEFSEERLEYAWEGDTAGFGGDDEAELADFRADFQKLGAEDVFVQCCIDYYEDVKHELALKIQRSQKRLPRESSAEQLRMRERIILNLKHQKQVEEKLRELYQTRDKAPVIDETQVER